MKTPPTQPYRSLIRKLLIFISSLILLESCDQVINEDVLPSGTKTFQLNGARMVAALNQKLSLKDMLANDKIGQTATLRIGQPANGFVMMDTATTTYKYVPEANFVGTDSIPYKVCQGGQCDSAVVVIEVKDSVAISDSCTLRAEGDWIIVQKDSNVRYPVYINDAVCGRFTIRLEGTPYFGTAYVDEQSRIVYTPKPGYAGLDKFQYSICQGATCSSTWAGISVEGETTDSTTVPPICPTQYAQADTLIVTVSRKDSASFTYNINVLANDVLCNSACTNFRVEIVTPPVAGSAVVGSDGKTIQYTAPRTPGITDQFKYRVCATCSGSQTCLDAPVYVSIE